MRDGALRSARRARGRRRACCSRSASNPRLANRERPRARVRITTGEALVSLDASPARGRGHGLGRRRQHRCSLAERRSRERGARRTRPHTARHAIRSRSGRASRGLRASPSPRSLLGKPLPLVRGSAWTSRTTPVPSSSDESGSFRALRDAFERARHEGIPQLVTLVGVPGMGKSRLVYELSRVVDADPEIVAWRQGRCLAYGDGIAFWALGEVVKAHAGILERDDEERGRREAASGGRRRSRRRERRRRGSSPTFGRSSGSSRRPGSAATAVARLSRPGAAFSKPLPSNARSCSCSRISTGRMTASSTSSTSSSTG